MTPRSASPAMGNTAPLSVWFNNDKASAKSLGGRLITDHNGFPWMMISESNDNPGLFSDALPNSNKVSFAHTTDGKRQVQSFSLNGTKKVVARLIACRDGR
jgi:hypothetical protein